MIGRTVTHYRILEELGGGGMGVVYKAEDTRLGRLVALKFLSEELSRDSDAIQRFQREARAASSLNHPNICTIYEFDEHEGRQFIVMELMEGRTLKDRIENKPLPAEEIVSLAAQITEGLEAAHERGIIHRDIKPGNLFITESGLVKVLDFGVAKLLPREEDATLTGSQTAAGGSALGTLAYMAPEQLNREKVDARTDIYALGCVLYEMATGRRPFAMEHGPQLLTSILNRAPEAPSKLNPEVPAWLDAIILKCLEKEPGRRYQSAKELQADLQRTPVSPRRVPGGSASTMVRISLVGVAAVLLLLAVALGLDVGGWRTRLLGGAGPPRIDSIAVLPLENLMGDPEQDYFVEGMHEALTSELSKISALKVISRTSAMQYKGVKKPAPQIARELGVAGLIEGSVLREGDQVRITVQLIHGPSDRHLWGQSFDRELRGILALQSEVARAVAEQIQVRLTPEEKTHLASTRRVDPEAYQLYLKGNFHVAQQTEDSIRKALEQYQQAIKKDPTYAAAYAGLALAWMELASWHSSLPPREVYPKAKEAVVKALELDPALPEAHFALGELKDLYEWDWAGADRAFKRGMELNPSSSYARLTYANFLTSMGRFEESIAVGRETLQLDPLSPVVYNELAFALDFAGRDEEALEYYRKGLEIDPDFPQSHWLLAEFYTSKGLFREALTHEEKLGNLTSGSPSLMGLRAFIYAKAGRRADARRIVEELQRRAKKEYMPGTALANAYLGLGEKEQALKWLEKAYEQRNLGLVWLKVQWQFDPLRTDPRFQALVRRMNFPEN